MTMKPISSVISTLPKAQHSKTSIVPTDTGAITELSGTQKDKAVARLLEVGQPTVVDESLVSLVESITQYKVSVNEITRYPEKGGFVSTLRGYTIQADTIDQVDQCITAVAKASVPMPYNMLRERLAILATLVIKPSGEAEEDIDLRMKSLAKRLEEFPADITSYAITQVERTQKFWPSFAEFYTHISWRLKKREYLMRDLLKLRVDMTANLQ
tara:strand:+ start:108 stop:746 length:639 start_codon:yes stop_codon:yes gene_type:complete